MTVPDSGFDGAPVDLLLGGRYRLREPIGSGGMAVVWRAHDDVLNRAVAVKVVKPSQAADALARERIRLEARAAAALSHPNIAQVHDYGEMDSAGQVFPYVVMELVPGGTLLRRLAAGPVTPPFAMRLGAEIAAALAAAHAEGLVHQDIKPGNVMLAPTGAKVVDFGIAAAVSPGRPGGAVDEVVLGTPAYLAPERLIGDAVLPASDVYALGIVLYRMLSGRSPWSDETTRQMLESHLYVPPAPLPTSTEVPDYVADLCGRCLAKDPAARPSAREVAEVLARGAGIPVVADEPGPPSLAAVAEPTVLVRPVRQVRTTPDGSGSRAVAPDGSGSRAVAPGRGRAVRWMAAAGVLLAAGAGGWVLLRETVQVGAEGRVELASPSAPRTGGVTSRPVTRPGSKKPGGPASAIIGRVPGSGVSQTAVPAASVPSAVPPSGLSVVPSAAPPAETRTSATPGATATTPAAPVERTFSSAGGTVVATCPAPRTARLLSWEEARAYQVQSVQAGPAAAPEVTFKRGKSLVTITVTCVAGVPDAAVSAA